MDARKGVSVIAARKPAALPALRIAPCRRFVSAAAQRRRALTHNPEKACPGPGSGVDAVFRKGHARTDAVRKIRYGCDSRRLLARTRFRKTVSAFPATT